MTKMKVPHLKMRMQTSSNDESMSDQDKPDKGSSASNSERSSSVGAWDLEPELQAIKGAYVLYLNPDI